MNNYRSWIEISSSALLNNAETIRSIITPDTKILAVVKANAYGHGLINCAQILEHKIDWFGVDSADEGIALRRAGIKKPILIMGFSLPEKAAEIIHNNLTQVVSGLEIIGALDDAAGHLGKQAFIHLKIDTGLARQGIKEQELSHFLSAAADFNRVKITGVLTHFAEPENDDDGNFTLLQMDRFNAALKNISDLGVNLELIHAANSAALLNHPYTHLNLVRPGIIIYGIWPNDEIWPGKKIREAISDIKLQPVLSLRSKIAQISYLKQGAALGYGLTEKVSRDSRLAILPLGYADGYDRRLSSVGEVLIEGKRAKIMGLITMNMTTVDITDIPRANINSVATFIGQENGDEITAQEIANKIGTITYELLARLNPYIPRITK